MKFYRNLFFFILISLAHVTTFAREIQVKSFETLSRDLTARTKRVDDLNGKMCALIKVVLPVEECKFEGDVVQQSFDVNEYLVYMPEGSKRLRIKCPGFETLQVELTTPEGDVGVKSGVTYSLKLSGYEDTGLSNKPVDPGANYLILDITPKTGLSVKVDGMLQTVDNGQVMTFLKYGTHSYAVEAEGYAPAQGTAVVGKDGNTTIQVHLESIMAMLIVKTETEGATIKINGQAKGTGNVSGQYAPGIYQIEIGKDGYRPYTQTIELAQRDNRSINIPALTPIYGALNISYKPIGATVTIDGKDVGTAPMVLRELLVGHHEISIKQNGYSPFQTNVEIFEGQTTQLEGSLTASVSKTNVNVPGATKISSGTINGHKYVDLGLPSGVLWATCNVGASSPSDYGDYFAWGETATKSHFEEVNNKAIRNMLEAHDITGKPQYDVARAKWGDSWRMPTKAEIDELRTKCTWVSTTQNGHIGHKVIGPNGNSIFLPHAGVNSGRPPRIFYGSYWSSTPANGTALSAWIIDFSKDSRYARVELHRTWEGRVVRPVSHPVTNTSGTTSTLSDTNGHEYVDLGLPSGVKWATCNIGASKPSDKGKAYHNGRDIDIDAAIADWGGTWRIPTKDEMEELVKLCRWSVIFIDGQPVYSATGPNGNSIIFSAVNPVVHMTNTNETIKIRSTGFYWCSEPWNQDGRYAYVLGFMDGHPFVKRHDSIDTRVKIGSTGAVRIRPVSN